MSSEMIELLRAEAAKGNLQAARFVMDWDAQQLDNGPNLTSARLVVTEMARAGQLRPVDDALRVAFLSLAKAVDADPGNAALWKQYQVAANSLRALVADPKEKDAGQALIDRLQAAVRDTENTGTEDQGRRSGGNRSRARPAADAVAANGRRRRPGASS